MSRSQPAKSDQACKFSECIYDGKVRGFRNVLRSQLIVLFNKAFQVGFVKKRHLKH